MYDTKVETIIDSYTHWFIKHINKIRSLWLNCDSSYRNRNRDVFALISFILTFRRTTCYRGTFPESGQGDLVKPKFPANRFTSIEEEPKNRVRRVESVGQGGRRERHWRVKEATESRENGNRLDYTNELSHTGLDPTWSLCFFVSYGVAVCCLQVDLSMMFTNRWYRVTLCGVILGLKSSDWECLGIFVMI